MRSYTSDVVQNIKYLATLPHIEVRELFNAGLKHTRWPLYVIETKTGNAHHKHNVLVSGGVHGDEPAGVWAALRFLEHYALEYLPMFHFTVLPCINPGGYVFERMQNGSGINLNRDFCSTPASEEAAAVISYLASVSKRYAFTMDFHECDPEFEEMEFLDHGFTKADNPSGFWLWELQNDQSKRIGANIIDDLRWLGIPISTQPKIFGDTNSGGVIYYPEGCGSPVYSSAQTFDAFLHRKHTDHAFTTETITSWDPKRRVQAHITALSAALDEYVTR